MDWYRLLDGQIQHFMRHEDGPVPAFWDNQSEAIELLGLGWSRDVGIRHTAFAAFCDGYFNGLTWPDAWEGHGLPAGPWVKNKSGSIDIDPMSAEENSAWRRGWLYGHDYKVASGRRNPMR